MNGKLHARLAAFALLFVLSAAGASSAQAPAPVPPAPPQPFGLRPGQEALAISFDTCDKHFKENFDLDALRDAAYGRAISGPLKLPTLGCLSSRLVKDFRQKLPAAAKK